MTRVRRTAGFSLRAAFLAALVGSTVGCGDDSPDTGVGSDAGADAGRVDTGASPDGGGTDGGSDAGTDAGTDGGGADAGVDGGTDGGTTNPGSLALAEARAAPDGPTSISVTDVYVTYIKPLVGLDEAGFFVQAEQAGPALFAQIPTSSLSVSLAVGDEVSFTITEMGTDTDQRRIYSLSGLAVASSGNDVTGLSQELAAVADVVTNVEDYESELVSVTASIANDGGFGGTAHLSWDIETEAVQDEPGFELRIPEDIADLAYLSEGCLVRVENTPLWRFRSKAQVSIWNVSEISLVGCPAPRLTSAVSLAPTEVRLEFDREIDPSSITNPATQFTFDSGLQATTASVSGSSVTLTTSQQSPGQSYTVTVDASVTDLIGTDVPADGNSASFVGFLALAVVHINEFQADLADGCDLLELRVVQGGSLAGMQVWQRGEMVLSFPSFSAQTNDFIVVHFDSADPNCNPGNSANEVNAPNQQPGATYGANFDTAYDWYSDPSNTGMIASTNVLAVTNATGFYIDVVFASDDPSANVASSTEDAAALAAAAGAWEMVGGGIPANGFVDDDFNAHAVFDLDAGETIQRLNDTDTNTNADWTTTNQAATWGALNMGQSAF